MSAYQYLRSFGMCKPGPVSKAMLKKLEKQDFWKKTDALYKKYKKSWKGPEISVFILPIDASNRRLMIEGKGKSGVSFPDRLFLFLSPEVESLQLEAIFTHEYHHSCRLQAQKKDLSQYTLLDSLIMEGLAEHTAEEACGSDHRASWCERLNENELEYYWEKHIKKNLEANRENLIHDKILFGQGGFPPLLGYTVGYALIKQFKKNQPLTVKDSIVLPSSVFYREKLYS
ncbi:DUF2268 domain-containing protein [Bacillus massilinigeriensis]|uniref:DUF2268 domain-containing protein n=1 Tax=Bacillus mediterraneensis TaxID=1805474 RepID=UPI0008F7FF2D|nr:DUF2268 domain-containing protein [Bacillus mediterraneensis]